MLKITGVEIELLTDLNMYEMIEKGLRGGMCQVSQKHVKANNKYMSNYIEDEISSYLSYLDANNLYGLAMTQKLPYSEPRWDDSIKTVEDVMNFNADGDYCCILDVDLEYPKELHDEHRDYPLAPENMKVSSSMISEYTNDIHKKYTGNDFKDEKTPKLILNLNDKKRLYNSYKELTILLTKRFKISKSK